MAKKREPKKIYTDVELEKFNFSMALNSDPVIFGVLLAGACLDRALETVLAAVLRKGETTLKLLDERGGILGSFQARTDIAYCLGLIPVEMHWNLSRLGEIRNKFAHSHIPIDFSNDEIVELCGNLRIPDHRDHKGNPVSFFKSLHIPETPCRRFEVAANQSFSKLRISVKRLKKLEEIEWPNTYSSLPT